MTRLVGGPYGGPPDGGLTIAMTEFAQRIDDAREEFVQTAREADVSPLVRAMVAAMTGVDTSPPPAAPAVPVGPVQARQEPEQLGWSARRNRGQA
ncbi:hypothetical protein [Streptomyces europaeiscabiei]|uniref:hypothetical protein n=1 Tax=Streptomyces europaeiscabiei TaxID=146819 RepID=UPI0038F68327